MAEDKKKEGAKSGSKGDGKSDIIMKGQNGVSKDEKETELSEEDKALVEKLNLLVQRAQDDDDRVRSMALEQIRTEIRSATSSMTSVPKPLKFLTDHYEPLKKFWFERERESDTAKLMADVLSVMAMTMSKEERYRECLKFKLAGQMKGVDTWGHEYVRHLAGQIGQEYSDIKLVEEKGVDGIEEDSFHDVSIEDLKNLVSQIVPFLMKSNAEAEAVDLITELQMLEDLPLYTEEHNFSRVCLYLESIAPFFPEPEDAAVLSTACKIYTLNNKPSHALRIALRLSDVDLIKSILNPGLESSIKLTPAARKQLVLDLGAACHFPKQGEEEEFLEMEGLEESEKEVLERLAFNRSLLKYYLQLAKELQVLEPKHPSDIYKQHLIDGSSNTSSSSTGAPDSARANLASTYVNAFVNAGFGSDRLMMADSVADGSGADGKENKPGWVYRNRDHGMMAASASLGLIQLWDIENGINNIDKFIHANEEFVRAGALLGVGMINSHVRSEFDPALAMLVDFVTKSVDTSGERRGLVEKIAAIAGLGIAYAGTDGEGCKDMLRDFLCDREEDPNVAAMAALALGLIGVGTADDDLSAVLVQSLSERTDTISDASKNLVNVLLPLGLGLLYMGKGEAVDVVLETVVAMCGEEDGPHKNRDLGKIAPLVLESCAYAGTGNVMKIQKLLSVVGKHESTDKEAMEDEGEENTRPSRNEAGSAANGEANGADENANGGDANGPAGANGQRSEGGEDENHAGGGSSSSDSSSPPSDGRRIPSSARTEEHSEEEEGVSFAAEQACAVLGLAMIAMGEDIGAEMIQRIYGHMLHYGEPAVKRAVPIAMGLTSVSNPRIAVMELLSKLSHDSDSQVAQNAIFALGLIGAGTNNSRIANLLRQLSVYYSKDPASLFLVRIAQALLHAGKGLVTLSPYHGDGRAILNKVELAGLLVVLYAALDMKATILGKSHYLLYFLSLTIHPRMLFTIDEQGEFLPVTVRVGQAVDTVGQAGRPKRITGFQTHSTPVLLAAGERAELGTEEYLSLAAGLQDTVILQKNPDYVTLDLEKIAKDGIMEVDSKTDDKVGSPKTGLSLSTKPS